jgi:hypothetical protein
MGTFAINPPNTPITDGNGVLAPAWYRFFVQVQKNMGDASSPINSGQFLALDTNAGLPSGRKFVPGSGLSATDAGAGGNYTLGLASTAVVAGSYGSAAKTVSFTVDAKGRLTAAAEFALSTSNVAEGTSLYYTDARARAAHSAGTGISYNSGTGAIALDTSSTRNADHAAVSVSAGAGLTGGGDLSANRTLALATSGVTAGTYSPVVSITVDAYGRITAIS